MALLAIALMPPGGAVANHKPIPPDNSALGQYVESVPDAGGDRPRGSEGGGGSSGGGAGKPGASGGPAPGSGQALPADVRRELEAHGVDGAGVAAIVPAGGSGGPGNRVDSGAAGRDGAAEQPAAGDDGSAVEDVVGAVTSGSGSGMGAALPIILGAALLAGIVVALARLRRRRTQPDA